MILTSPLLDTDIQRITSSGNHTAYKTFYEAVLHSPIQNCDITPFLKFVEVLRNYNMNAMDDIRIRFHIDGSLYRKYFDDHLDHLEVTLIKNRGNKIFYPGIRYKAFVIYNSAEEDRKILENGDDKSLSSFTPIEMELQLVHREVYAMNGITCEGVYKLSNVLKVMYAEYKNKVNALAASGSSDLQEVKLNIADPDNEEIYGHIIIPTGTKLLDLAPMLQNGENYGVYNGGLGIYFQNYKEHNNIFIYPLYSSKRYDEETGEEPKLVIYNSSRLRDGFERTFMLDGLKNNIVRIVCQTDTGVLDRGSGEISNTGDVLVMSNNDNTTKSLRNVDGDKITGTSKTNMKVQGLTDKRDGAHNIQYVGATNNPYKYRTTMMRKQFSKVEVKWESCDIDLITPGMPVAFVYENKSGDVTILKGTVQGTAERFMKEYNASNGMIIIEVESPEQTRSGTLLTQSSN